MEEQEPRVGSAYGDTVAFFATSNSYVRLQRLQYASPLEPGRTLTEGWPQGIVLPVFVVRLNGQRIMINWSLTAIFPLYLHLMLFELRRVALEVRLMGLKLTVVTPHRISSS
jgi:hypothetical protein